MWTVHDNKQIIFWKNPLSIWLGALSINCNCCLSYEVSHLTNDFRAIVILAEETETNCLSKHRSNRLNLECPTLLTILNQSQTIDKFPSHNYLANQSVKKIRGTHSDIDQVESFVPFAYRLAYWCSSKWAWILGMLETGKCHISCAVEPNILAQTMAQ